MKRLAVVLTLSLAILSASCSGQSANQATAAKAQQEKQPGTALETFLAKHGEMIMKEFYDVGNLRDMGRVQIQGLVISNVGGSQKRKGLRVDVFEAGSYERENVSFVDIDELESLSHALAYMSETAAKWNSQTAAPYTEVIYTSKGELQVGFYRKGSGDSSAFCKSGTIGSASAYFKVSELATFKGFVDQAIALLKTK